MPGNGIKLIPHEQILRYEEIIDFVKIAVNYGINKIRLTGGEPLVRKGIVSFIHMLSEIKEIKDLALTTNGFYLEEMAHELKQAGIHRINVSIDSLNPDKFKEITRGGNVEKVVRGILKAKEVGFHPIKINIVNLHDSQQDIENVTAFAKQHGFEVRLIQLMILEKGLFSKVEGGDGGNCSQCNRLRLTSDGYLMPCLFNDIKFSIRKHGYEQALLLAVRHKPQLGLSNHTRHFCNIGG